MKRKNSTLNIVLAIVLLIISILSFFTILGSYAAIILIPLFSPLRAIVFSKWDYTFWAIAWTMLHSYMIVLSIEWLRGKSIKHDMTNTLTLFLIMGLWGVIRTSSIGIIGILTFIIYGSLLFYFYRTKTKKLFT